MKKTKKCGFVAVVGTPNAGKSTLVNTLTGQKVSIVTPKAQTTRNRIRGIRVHNNAQVIFVDTPGIFKVKGRLDNRLNRSIVETAKNAFEGTDYIMYMFDASKKITEDEEEVINFLKGQSIPKILVLNKVDVIDKARLLEISPKLNELLEFEKTFMISATKGKGVEDILNYLSEKLPDGPYLYPEDEISDFPARLLAADVTREKLFMNLREEVPYNIMVETEKYEEGRKDIKIHQSIYTVSETHKRMIIGAKGAIVKKVGEQSRIELTKIFGKKVHLFLYVKVKENWMTSKDSYVTSGIDYSDKV
jgi:GTP-binding protein Era